MSYTPRSYEDIVRDMLTTLTGGTVQGKSTVPSGDRPIIPAEAAQPSGSSISSLEAAPSSVLG